MKDIDIRRELKRTFLSHYLADPETRIIEELGLCQGLNKIDIAVINSYLVGCEIKSEQDTLQRLPSQVDVYNKIFDFLYIITNDKHLKNLKKIIPEFWGILVISKRGDQYLIKSKRKPTLNPLVDSEYLVQLLWKDEAFEILQREGIGNGLKNKPKSILWKKISDSLTLYQINKYVREYLRGRSNWKVAESQQQLSGGSYQLASM